MTRLLRLAALTLGAPLLLLLVGGLGLLLARLALAWFFPGVPEAEHLAQKQRYLAALPRVDPATAPRFVVILFDDLGWGDLSSYGNALIQTPRIDRAAAEGLRMTDFYAASPVCTPSRAALLTGRYPPRPRTDRHVFFPARSPLGLLRRVFGLANDLPRDEITLAEVLGVPFDLVVISNGIDRADSFTQTAFDALSGVDVKHPPTFIDAIDRADFGALTVLDVDTIAFDNQRHRIMP